jgi:hypothetical protein
MRSNHAMVVVLACTSSVALAQRHCSSVNVDRSSGFCTVPDPNLTPGEMDESLACVSNVNRPRQVSEVEKNAILKAYGTPAGTDKSSGEFDHWLPHWMGGSDSSRNIWFEPHAGKFGSFAKDKVELLLYRKVCVDKTMTLGDAKALYLKGWTLLWTKK